MRFNEWKHCWELTFLYFQLYFQKNTADTDTHTLPEIFLLSTIYLSMQSKLETAVWLDNNNFTRLELFSLSLCAYVGQRACIHARTCMCACACVSMYVCGLLGEYLAKLVCLHTGIFGCLLIGLCFVWWSDLHQSFWLVHMSHVPAVNQRVTGSLLEDR